MPNKKVLIIDDERDLFELVKIRLESQDYEVLYLESAQGALQFIREKKPDLILLDIVMPDKNGYDLCYEIKHDENTASIPVVLFTAKLEWKIKMDELCKFVKADDYISKPFESQELLDKIKGLLEA